MKKNVILGVFGLLILSTTVLAQTKLDPSIYDENGVRLYEDIPDSSIEDTSVVPDTTNILDTPEEPQIKTEAFKQGDPASCFDYYTFGSIGVNLQTDTSAYAPGDPVLIRGQITNNNRYPVTNLTIRARLVRNTPDPEYLRSEIITLNDFNVAENITVNAGSTFDIKHSHLLPLNAPKGEYQLFFYAYNNDRFNQAGLSFTNDIVASRLSFDVTGKNPQQVYLDQTQIELNDQVHNVMAFMTQHEMNTPIKVSIPLVNPSAQDEEMNVTYTLYKWDGLRKENIVDTKTETITVPANGEVKLTYSANKTDTSVYFLNITADNKTLKKDKSVYNIKTESNIRFVVNGYDFPRINSFGVDTYPLKANQEATLFTCYHNGADQDTLTPVNISTVLYDDKGKVIAQTEYDGKIGGSIETIIKKFTLKKDLANYTIVTTLKDNTGKILDTIENNYKCSEIDPTLCPQPTNLSWIWILLGLLVFIVIILVIRKVKSKMNIPTVMFTLLLLIVPLFSAPQEIEAAIVTSNAEAKIYCIRDCNEPQDAKITLEVKSLYGPIKYTIQKEVNFKRSDQTKTPNLFDLNINEKVALDVSKTTADWFFYGKVYDSPPADYLFYKIAQKKGYYAFGNTSRPYDKNEVNISSQDSSIVSCDSLGCTAKKPGTTTVTVSFPDNPTVAERPWVTRTHTPSIGPNAGKTSTYRTQLWCNNVEDLSNEREYWTQPILYGKEKDGYTIRDHIMPTQECIPYLLSNVYGGLYTTIGQTTAITTVGGPLLPKEGYWAQYIKTPLVTYSFPSITYTVVVPEVPNTPQITSCAGISSGVNSGTINWAYSDADNDKQDGYQIQIATSSDFASDTIIKNIAGTTGDTSEIITGLLAETTYYARVRTNNATNGWSAWTGDVGGGTACSSFIIDQPADMCPHINGEQATLPSTTYQSGTDCLCSNGATDPIACTTCPVNQNMVAGECTDTTDVTLNVIKGGAGGSGTVSGGAISCGGTCSQTYNPANNVSVTLTASALTGSIFTGWFGAGCSGTGLCTVIMSENRGVQANFDLEPCLGPACGGDVTGVEFKFNPKIAGADGKCSFTLKAENVKSCTIKNRLGTEVAPFNPLSATPAGSINETNRKLSIGTYSLECKKLDDSNYIHPDTISCSSNPNLEEF